MKRLWAPWRKEYIDGHGTAKGCIFCDAFRQSDEEAYVVLRGKAGLIMLNRYPYTGGHLLVVPREHEDTLEKLPDPTLLALMRLTRTALAALRGTCKARAFNVGMNIGEAAGAGVADHVHLHIVPRWPGDTNFMTTMGEVRVLPESLADTWTKLREALQRNA